MLAQFAPSLKSTGTSLLSGGPMRHIVCGAPCSLSAHATFPVADGAGLSRSLPSPTGAPQKRANQQRTESMNGLIRASLNNVHAVIVFALTILVLGVLVTWFAIPIDILPVFKAPAVQVLTFYGGMPARGMEKDITNRMERWTGQANGIVRQYFQDDVDPNGALTQVNSLALSVLPNLPPGTLPPVVLPFDPTSSTPVCIVAVDSPGGSQNQSILYDVGRY